MPAFHPSLVQVHQESARRTVCVCQLSARSVKHAFEVKKREFTAAFILCHPAQNLRAQLSSAEDKPPALLLITASLDIILPESSCHPRSEVTFTITPPCFYAAFNKSALLNRKPVHAFVFLLSTFLSLLQTSRRFPHLWLLFHLFTEKYYLLEKGL